MCLKFISYIKYENLFKLELRTEYLSSSLTMYDMLLVTSNLDKI